MPETAIVTDETTVSFATRGDARHYVAETLSEWSYDYDIDAITDRAFTYRIDTDAHGHELLNTARIEQVVDDVTFWTIVAAHAHAPITA